MTEKTISEYIFNSTSRIHEATDELYEYLHPNGHAMTSFSGNALSRFRKYMQCVKAEVDGLREILKQNDEEINKNN